MTEYPCIQGFRLYRFGGEEIDDDEAGAIPVSASAAAGGVDAVVPSAARVETLVATRSFNRSLCARVSARRSSSIGILTAVLNKGSLLRLT